tara:strand:+ start:242 stop:496 length:255 start_codon:yes stop_codon:yes gene_type:complete
MKYYVESGNLKTVIDSTHPMKACIKSLRREVLTNIDDLSAVEFEDTFFVSERGFLSDREPFSIEIPQEKIYDTEDILSYLDDIV